MKKIIAGIGTLAVTVASAVTLTPDNLEVVVAKEASPVVRFACDELTNFLAQAFGASVRVAATPTEGRASLVLGANAWSAAEGLKPEAHPRDTYLVKAVGSRVYILGQDDPRADVYRRLNDGSYARFEKGTVFGVYGFLEKFAGLRMYFPGELGTVVPKTRALEIPDGTSIVSTPACLVRRYYTDDGVWFEENDHKPGYWKGLMWIRNRAATMDVPCCHGLRRFELAKDFGQTHPEYFSRNSDGTRCNVSDPKHHLCLSSDVREEIAQRTIARMRKGAKYVDIMPNDAMPDCYCEKCQQAYKTPEGRSELVWDMTRYVANRVKAEGLDGIVTQMAYGSADVLPRFDLPDNVRVMVAVSGPWSLAKKEQLALDYAKIRAWKAKTGTPIWIWTYPHKFWKTNIAGIPDVAPRAMGHWYQEVVNDIFGTFAETETDVWLYHYLNYHVLCRLLWDADADVDAIVDEHHRLMFGAAAPEMKAFYDDLENKWISDFCGTKEQFTPLGPIRVPPTLEELFTQIYSPEAIAGWDKLFDRAFAKVAPESLEARRLALFRREYLGRIKAGAKTWFDHHNAVRAHRWPTADGQPMRLCEFAKSRVYEAVSKPIVMPKLETLVDVRRTADALIVDFDCEEPALADCRLTERRHDDPMIWEDSSVEIFLNPTGDRANYYQFCVNLRGDLTDWKGFCSSFGKTKIDISWESGATAKARTADGRVYVTVTIPLAAFGDLPETFPAEFVRSREMLDGKPGRGRWCWSPWLKYNTNELGEYGTCTPRVCSPTQR